MRVLGLVGSPRRQGNSEIIVKEMMDTLPGDWEKNMLRLNDLHIERCKACYACLPQEKTCILKDDLDYFLSQIQSVDKVIIAAPVYYLGQQTSLKLINDRMISIQNNSDEYFKGKQCVIVIPHAIPGWEGYAREATMHFARFLGLNVTGVLGINARLPGDVVYEPAVGSIRRLAASLIDNACVDFSDPGQVYCPDCASSLLQIFHRGNWRCVMCGASGEWSVTDERFELSWQTPEHRRYTREEMREHGEILDQVKREFILHRERIAALQQQYRNQQLWIKPGEKG